MCGWGPRENPPFSGRIRHSPGECGVLRENGPFSGRMGRSPGEWCVLRPRWAGWRGSARNGAVGAAIGGGGGAGHAAGGALSAAPAPLSGSAASSAGRRFVLTLPDSYREMQFRGSGEGCSLANLVEYRGVVHRRGPLSPLYSPPKFQYILFKY